MDVKFRAWDMIEGGWVQEEWMRRFAGAWLLGEIPKEIVLQRFTGLKDKNGTEIYEGDIIKYRWYEDWFDDVGKETTGEVSWRSVLDVTSETYVCGWVVNTYDPISKNCEVVGNIFENPELIDTRK